MKLREEFIQKCLADFHYELTREQMEQDWFLDKKNPYYKEKDCYIFRTANNCRMEIATKDLDSAFTEPFIVCDGRATEKKKHKGGYELLKEKYAKLEKERDKLKEQLSMQIAPDFETFKRVEKERDEWKAKYEQKCEHHSSILQRLDEEVKRRDFWRNQSDKNKERIAFLLKHCPFWVRWMYRRQFKEGE